MNRLVTLAIALALIGCKKDKAEPPEEASGSAPGSAAVPPPPVSIDAGAPVADAAAADTDAEPARRKGKKTGLGAPDEKPEVVVEDLVRALGTGKVPAARFVDPKRGVVERISLPGGSDKPTPDVKKTHCGAKAQAGAAAYIKKMVKAEEAGAGNEVHQISCGNEFIATDDPDFGADEMGDKPAGAVPMKHATCIAAGAGEYDEIFHVVFVPDAERGFRIAAVVSTEGGANTGKLWSEVAKEITSPKGCK